MKRQAQVPKAVADYFTRYWHTAEHPIIVQVFVPSQGWVFDGVKHRVDFPIDRILSGERRDGCTKPRSGRRSGTLRKVSSGICYRPRSILSISMSMSTTHTTPTPLPQLTGEMLCHAHAVLTGEIPALKVGFDGHAIDAEGVDTVWVTLRDLEFIHSLDASRFGRHAECPICAAESVDAAFGD